MNRKTGRSRIPVAERSPLGRQLHHTPRGSMERRSWSVGGEENQVYSTEEVRGRSNKTTSAIKGVDIPMWGRRRRRRSAGYSRRDVEEVEMELIDDMEDMEEVEEITLGTRVLISGVERGTVRYVGGVHFQDGLWLGVELDSKKGRHGGMVDGRRYFSCPRGYGVLAPVDLCHTEPMLRKTVSGSNDRAVVSRTAGESSQRPSVGQHGVPLSATGHPLGPSANRTAGRTVSRPNGSKVSQRNRGGEDDRPPGQHKPAGVTMRRSLQPPTWRASETGKRLTDLNRTVTLTSPTPGLDQSPDIVTSCDRRSETSEDSGSKRSSQDMEDESFGILSPTQMKDFSVNSMTQSMASVSSFIRDVSWDDLNSCTVTEDITTRDEPSDPISDRTVILGEFNDSNNNKGGEEEDNNLHSRRQEVAEEMRRQVKVDDARVTIRRGITTTISSRNISSRNTSSDSLNRTFSLNSESETRTEIKGSDSGGKDRGKFPRDRRDKQLIEDEVGGGGRSEAMERGRFCLDTSKLEEIEALGSSPLQSSCSSGGGLILTPPSSSVSSCLSLGEQPRLLDRTFHISPPSSPPTIVRGGRPNPSSSHFSPTSSPAVSVRPVASSSPTRAASSSSPTRAASSTTRIPTPTKISGRGVDVCSTGGDDLSLGAMLAQRTEALLGRKPTAKNTKKINQNTAVDLEPQLANKQDIISVGVANVKPEESMEILGVGDREKKPPSGFTTIPAPFTYQPPSPRSYTSPLHSEVGQCGVDDGVAPVDTAGVTGRATDAEGDQHGKTGHDTGLSSLAKQNKNNITCDIIPILDNTFTNKSADIRDILLEDLESEAIDTAALAITAENTAHEDATAAHSDCNDDNKQESFSGEVAIRSGSCMSNNNTSTGWDLSPRRQRGVKTRGFHVAGIEELGATIGCPGSPDRGLGGGGEDSRHTRDSRLRLVNKQLEKVQNLADSLYDSTYSRSEGDSNSLAVSVTLSTDMESSGFFSDLDGRHSNLDSRLSKEDLTMHHFNRQSKEDLTVFPVFREINTEPLAISDKPSHNHKQPLTVAADSHCVAPGQSDQSLENRQQSPSRKSRENLSGQDLGGRQEIVEDFGVRLEIVEEAADHKIEAGDGTHAGIRDKNGKVLSSGHLADSEQDEEEDDGGRDGQVTARLNLTKDLTCEDDEDSQSSGRHSTGVTDSSREEGRPNRRSETKRKRGEGGGDTPNSCSGLVNSPGRQLTPDAKKPRKRSTEKGVATMRKQLLKDKPIVPNTNVPSKVKALLSDNSSTSKSKEPREKKINRWDAVMNKIEERRAEMKPFVGVKRVVRSKVFADFVPPLLPTRPYNSKPAGGGSGWSSRENSTVLSPRSNNNSCNSGPGSSCCEEEDEATLSSPKLLPESGGSCSSRPSSCTAGLSPRVRRMADVAGGKENMGTAKTVDDADQRRRTRVLNLVKIRKVSGEAQTAPGGPVRSTSVGSRPASASSVTGGGLGRKQSPIPTRKISTGGTRTGPTVGPKRTVSTSSGTRTGPTDVPTRPVSTSGGTRTGPTSRAGKDLFDSKSPDLRIVPNAKGSESTNADSDSRLGSRSNSTFSSGGSVTSRNSSTSQGNPKSVSGQQKGTAAATTRKVSAPLHRKVSVAAQKVANQKKSSLSAQPLKEQNRVTGDTTRRRLGDQPDLVKESLGKERRKDAEKERQEAEREAARREKEEAKEAAVWNARGFEALAVMVAVYVNKVKVLEDDLQVAKIKSGQIEGLTNKSEVDHEVLERKYREEVENLRKEEQRLRQEGERLREEKETARVEWERLLDNEKKAREQALADLAGKLETEKAELRTLLDREKLEAGERLQAGVAEAEAKYREEKEAVLTTLECEKARLEEELVRQRELVTKEKEELEETVKKERQELEEVVKKERQELAEKCQRLETKKGAGDHRLEAERKKVTRLEQEVASLHSVLEMKTAELHESRLGRVKLEERLGELEQREEGWRKASAMVEDLREQLTARLDMERRLQEENRSLSDLVEKEVVEKKRLSMENEQLNWKMRQEGEGSLTLSYCEGTDHSLPIMGTHSRGSFRGRPLSAPPKGVCGHQPPESPRFLAEEFDSLPPHSPRVLEVVEKTESVAWKLEYDLPLMAEPSPSCKRKLSPQSPLFLRKCKSSGLMTRSLDRASLTLVRSNSTPGPGAGGPSGSPGPQRRGLPHHQGGSQGGSPGLQRRGVPQGGSPGLQRRGVPQGASQGQQATRSNSVRRKILPTFETLSESTESESEESKKNSPDREHHSEYNPPHPVDIGPASAEDELLEISSSSEIEIGGNSEPTSATHTPGHRHHHHHHRPQSFSSSSSWYTEDGDNEEEEDEEDEDEHEVVTLMPGMEANITSGSSLMTSSGYCAGGHTEVEDNDEDEGLLMPEEAVVEAGITEAGSVNPTPSTAQN